MLDGHRATDALELEPDVAAKTTARLARLARDAQQLREWLATHPTDRRGPTGGLRQSNRTNNESAKMATDKGVIQGYTGVATVDAKHQIIVDAQTHGTGSEQELLLLVVEALATLRTSETVLTADAGYHNEANLAAVAALKVTALVADPDMRTRDERFADRNHHTTAPDPLHDKSREATPSSSVFTPSDFTYDADARTCVCPAGKALYRKGASNVTNGYVGEHFRGEAGLCTVCVARAVSAHRRDDGRSQRRLFSRARVGTDGVPHEAHVTASRCTGGARAVRATVWHGGAGVWQHALQQTARSLHAARPGESERPLAALFSVHNIEKLTHAGYAA